MNQIVYSGEKKKGGKVYVILGSIIFVVALAFIGFGVYGLINNQGNQNANLNQIAKNVTTNTNNTVTNVTENDVANVVTNTTENTTTNVGVGEETDTQKPSITQVEQVGGQVNVSVKDNAALDYLVYKINTNEEVKVTLQGTEQKVQVPLQKGSNLLSIVVSDKAGNLFMYAYVYQVD